MAAAQDGKIGYSGAAGYSSFWHQFFEMDQNQNPTRIADFLLYPFDSKIEKVISVFVASDALSS